MEQAENRKKSEWQFCTICGASFESEYKLIKHLNLSHPEALGHGCCSDSDRHTHGGQ